MESVSLGTVASVKSGFAFKSKDWKDDGIPVIKIANVKDGFVTLDGCSFVDEAVARNASAFELKPGDILISMTGYIGEVARVRNEGRMLLNQRVGKFSIRIASKLDNDFLFYCLRNPELKAKFAAHAYGAAQPNISPSLIEQQEIPLPSLPTQRRIAGILSAYDELIENSQRRIKILESMARALYREWFVHFRFPGQESVPRVPSPLGEIPKGWEVKKLFDLTKVNYGKNLPIKKLADDGTYPVYGAARIIGRYTEYTREQRTIICGCRGSVGEMQITQPQCYVTNNSFTFDPTHADNYFWLFHTLKERGLRDVVGGAAQPQITLEGISSVELITPPLPLRASFQQAVSALFEKIWILDSQIANLRRTRDFLLPRLLSGQIDVEAIAS